MYFNSKACILEQDVLKMKKMGQQKGTLLKSTLLKNKVDF